MRTSDRARVAARTAIAVAGVMAAAAAGAQQAPAGEISVYAAGSLRGALTEVATAWQTAQPGARARLTFGASGLLRDRLLGTERADVFASANMEHPQALAAAGKAAAPRVFLRNRLCALGAPNFDATPATLVARLLDPAVRVATSTPKADPAGDYAFAMFERIEKQGHAGANKLLADKALQLTGGPNSPPPTDRNVYGDLMARGQADVFITYCTNVVIAQREQPSLKRIEVPEAVNVGASYGVSVLNGAPGEALRFVEFLLGAAGQQVFARHGFAAP
jgi:molybdate transport system substrate-binding protein